MSLLGSSAPKTGYMVLPSGIGFTREQATTMSALHIFPGWKPLVDAIRHMALEAQERMMSRYAGMDDINYEKGYVNALDEVVDLVQNVIPSAYATLLTKEASENGDQGTGEGTPI